MDLDAFKATGILRILTPDEALGNFIATRERMPVDQVVTMRPPGLPADRFRAYAQLFADKVIRPLRMRASAS